MEIERKYLIAAPPAGYRSWPFHQIEQAYLCTDPTVRVRREDDEYYMTYKSRGLLAREEYNLPLTKEAYAHLLAKADGIVLTKKRYLKPLAEAYAEDACRPGISSAEPENEDTAENRGEPSQENGAPSLSANHPNVPAKSGGSPAGASGGSEIPYDPERLTIEMDVFEGAYEGLILAEVEFPTKEAALAFTPPSWFGRDVTFTGEYQNSRLALSNEKRTDRRSHEKTEP